MVHADLARFSQENTTRTKPLHLVQDVAHQWQLQRGSFPPHNVPASSASFSLLVLGQWQHLAQNRCLLPVGIIASPTGASLWLGRQGWGGGWRWSMYYLVPRGWVVRVVHVGPDSTARSDFQLDLTKFGKHRESHSCRPDDFHHAQKQHQMEEAICCPHRCTAGASRDIHEPGTWISAASKVYLANFSQGSCTVQWRGNFQMYRSNVQPSWAGTLCC